MHIALSSLPEKPKASHSVAHRDAVTMSRKLEEIAKQRSAEAHSQSTQNVVQLPLWVDAVRGVPNAVLRAALFGVTMKGARAYLERKEIHAQEGIRIVYTGARLDQGDLDVWETVLHIARIQALGDECRVTAYQLLKALGKTDTGKNRGTLEHRLSRMNATALDVKVSKFSYEGSLIDEVYRAEKSRKYIIRLNPKLSNLFAADQFSRLIGACVMSWMASLWLSGFTATTQATPSRSR